MAVRRCGKLFALDDRKPARKGDLGIIFDVKWHVSPAV